MHILNRTRPVLILILPPAAKGGGEKEARGQRRVPDCKARFRFGADSLRKRRGGSSIQARGQQEDGEGGRSAEAAGPLAGPAVGRCEGEI